MKTLLKIFLFITYPVWAPLVLVLFVGAMVTGEIWEHVSKTVEHDPR